MGKEQIENLAMAAARDKTALITLYDYFFPKIFAYVAWRVGTRSDAEDITSTIFLKMVRSIAIYKTYPKSSFQAWLYRIAQTTIIDFYRTHHTSITLEDIPDLSDPTHNLGALFDLRLEFKQTLEALNRLPDRQAEIIRLKFIAELSNQEIAALLHINEKSVSAAVSKGLVKLRNFLKR